MTTVPDVRDLMNQLMAHALTSGLFESVNGHESDNAPGDGISATFLMNTVDPIPEKSGLDVTSLGVDVLLRLQMNLQHEPQDDIDMLLGNAAVAMIAAYSGAFSLEGEAMMIDLVGTRNLAARFGYLLKRAGSTDYRIVEMHIPVIFADVIDQEA